MDDEPDGMLILKPWVEGLRIDVGSWAVKNEDKSAADIVNEEVLRVWMKG